MNGCKAADGFLYMVNQESFCSFGVQQNTPAYPTLTGARWSQSYIRIHFARGCPGAFQFLPRPAPHSPAISSISQTISLSPHHIVPRRPRNVTSSAIRWLFISLFHQHLLLFFLKLSLSPPPQIATLFSYYSGVSVHIFNLLSTRSPFIPSSLSPFSIHLVF